MLLPGSVGVYLDVWNGWASNIGLEDLSDCGCVVRKIWQTLRLLGVQLVGPKTSVQRETSC